MYRILFCLLLFAIALPAAHGKPRRGRSHGGKPSDAADPAAKTRAPRSARRRSQAAVTFDTGVSLRVVKGATGRGQEHYDPNGSGNPLLDTGPENRARKVSKNFTVGEFARSGRRHFFAARIDRDYVGCLQQLRDSVGRPVQIESGYRSFKYNRELYERMGRRPSNSQHISGRAADIRIAGMTGKEIAQAAIDACGSDVAVGLGAGFAHVDGRGSFDVWNYKGVSSRQVAEVRRYRTARLTARGRGRDARRTAARVPSGGGRGKVTSKGAGPGRRGARAE